MNRTFLGEFRAYGTGTIITNGRGLPGYVIATDGTITLGDELTCRWFRFDRGTLDTNNFGVTANIAGSTIASAGVKTLTLGSSVVDVLGWNYSGSNLTVTANTATIKITGTGAVGLGSANWNGADFNLNGTAHTVSGSPTGIAIITTPPATTQTLTITAGSVIKCTTATLSGDATHAHTILSGTAGTLAQIWATNKTDAFVTYTDILRNYNGVIVSDCTGAGGGTFAGAGGVFTSMTIQGAGAYTLTVTGANTIPTVTMTAPLGTLLFSGEQDIVTLTHTSGTVDLNDLNHTIEVFDSNNANVRTVNMGTGTLTVDSAAAVTKWDITDATNLTFNHENSTIALSNAAGTAQSFYGGGVTYNVVQVIGAGAYTMTFEDSSPIADLVVNAANGTAIFGVAQDFTQLTHTQGTVTLNNLSHNIGIVDSNNGNVRTLNLGTGTLTVDATGAVTKWDITNPNNLTLNENTSEILLTNSTANAQIFAGGGETYNDLTVEGAGAYTLTITGANGIDTLTVNAPSGTTSMGGVQDITNLVHTSGTLDFNNQDANVEVFDSNNANVRIVNMGTGTITVDSAAAATKWDITDPTNLTFNHENCTIVLTNATANAQAFAGGGQTYNDVTVEGAGDYPLTISGDNTFATFTTDRSVVAKTLTVTSGSTQTVTTFVCAVNGGVYLTIDSTIPGTPGNLVMVGGGTFDGMFLDITDSAAYPNPAWYAVWSIDGGGVSGWVFHPLGLINHAWYEPNYIVEATDHDGVEDVGGSDTTITDATMTEAPGYWIDALVTITASASAAMGESRVCTVFAGGGVITVAPAFSANVAFDDEFTIDFGTLIDRSYYGLDFDGADDYINVPHDASQLLTTGGTIEAWIKPDTVGEGAGKIVDKSSGGFSGQQGYSFMVDAPNRLLFIINGAGTRTSAIGSIVFGDGNWYHTVATWDDTGYVIFYVNGSQSGTPGGATNPAGITTVNALRIGNRSNATDRTFDGGIDSVRIYNRELGLTEIEYNYNSGVGNYTPYSTTGLIAEFHMEEGSGTNVDDTSTTANNGTITGATWINGKVPRPAGNSGTNDSRITWGVNPSDITTILGSLYSTAITLPATLEPAQDIIPETPELEIFGMAAPTNMFSPLFDTFADVVNVPSIILWLTVSMLFVVGGTVGAYFLFKNATYAAFIGLFLQIICVAAGTLPWWTIIIAFLLAVYAAIARSRQVA